MAKYAVVVNSNFENPNRYERQSALEFIEEQNHGFILCDEFDIAISTFLEKCAEFLPRDWHRVWTISEAIQEEYIEGDENDIDTLNNMEEQIDKMLEDKKARYIDVYNMSYITDYTVENDYDYFDIINNSELVYRELLGDDYYRTVYTNIFKMDNPEKEYFVEVTDISKEDYGEKVAGRFASVRLIPIDE